MCIRDSYKSGILYENVKFSSKKTSREQKYIGNPCTKCASAIFVKKKRPRSLVGTHRAPKVAFPQRGSCKTHIDVQAREEPTPKSMAFPHRRCRQRHNSQRHREEKQTFFATPPWRECTFCFFQHLLCENAIAKNHTLLCNILVIFESS